MSGWLPPLLPLFSRSDSGSRRPTCRLLLESLEDRCLLSGGYAQVNLASDVPGLARVLDPNLVNPWGLSYSPTGPFWSADNGSGVSDLLDGRGQFLPLTVLIPSLDRPRGTPTGTVFNGGPGFAVSENGVSRPSRFLFATEDGTIAGWNSFVDPTRALRVVDNSSSGAVYKGLALAADPAGHSLLYAANFGRGTIDVFDQNFQPIARAGSFEDPGLPDGYAPFNIQAINNLLFVTYAQQDSEDKGEEEAGAGHGFIDVYGTDGTLVRRFASEGMLDSPWGLALAPASFGPFGGALLVGNVGDGHINAYDPGSGAFLGQLADSNGGAITIPDLWALMFGNDHAGGASDTLFFTAGVNYEEHGLFGAIQSPERIGADTAGPGVFDPDAPGEPDDYPLPPSDGPTLQAHGDGPSLPVAVLLPLTESSLAMIPTLSTVSQPDRRNDAPAPAASVAVVSFDRSVAMALLASGTTLLLASAKDSQPQRDTQTNSIPLNAFLDWNASQNLPSSNATAQQPDTDLAAAGRAAGAKGFLAELPIEQRPTRSSETQGFELPGTPVQVDKVFAQGPSAGFPESPNERGAENERVETQGRAGWTRLLNAFLFAACIPGVWVSARQRRSRFQRRSVRGRSAT